jgi:hypothetical protein
MTEQELLERLNASGRRDEMLALWTNKLRGPMADLESQARAALDDLGREGYAGAAAPKLQHLVDDASLVARVTAGWDKDGRTPEEHSRT